jgi:hypothetical protein
MDRISVTLVACALVSTGALAALSTACGTSPASSSGPPLDPSKKLSALSTSELGAFCDWTAQQEGGYGKTTYCEANGAPLYAPTDQATCVMELSQHASEPDCSATVGQWTPCVQWLDANFCDTTPATLPAECSVIQAMCYGSGSPMDGGLD